MPTCFFEAGHTAAEFSARHMMVTNVRGHFKNVHGTLTFDEADPCSGSVEVQIDARGLWTGEPERDAHLGSADFLDVERHPQIRFSGRGGRCLGAHDFVVEGDLTIRGITRKVRLDVHYLKTWSTPWWEDGRDKGPKLRAGFVARTRINRHDFGVSWNSALDKAEWSWATRWRSPSMRRRSWTSRAADFIADRGPLRPRSPPLRRTGRHEPTQH